MMTLIRPSELIEKLKISRTTLWRLTNDKNSGFPPKINISERLIGYDEALINAWLVKKTIEKRSFKSQNTQL